MIAASAALYPDGLPGFDIARECTGGARHGKAGGIGGSGSQVQQTRFKVGTAEDRAAIVVKSCSGEINHAIDRPAILVESKRLPVVAHEGAGGNIQSGGIVENTAHFVQGQGGIGIDGAKVE